MGKVLLTVPQRINFEYQITSIDVAKEILALIESITQRKATKNRLLGLFEDKPEIMDEITETAMQSRENQILRVTDE